MNKKIIITLICFVCLIAAVITGSLLINGKKISNSNDEDKPKIQEKLESGVVSYKGNKYKYNSSIRTYLYMGIDKDGPVREAEDSISGGQADALFLLVNDSKNHKNSIITINRNTMTQVDVYKKDGEYDGAYKLQICLQHGYGNGLRESCIRTEKTVSKLFYNLPIDGFLSLRLDGIPKLNDAIGGVSVEVLEDIDRGDIHLKKGEEKKLTGEETYAYLRNRDLDEFESSVRRQERHIQYMTNFFDKVGKEVGTDVKKAIELYSSIEEYTVTDIDFVNLTEDVLKYGFNQEDMYTTPGITEMGSEFEEFYISEEEFYEMILEIFYERV